MPVEIKIIPQADLSFVIGQIPHGLSKGVLFSGDRFFCIDEGVALIEDDTLMIGLATIAPYGEMMSGNPTVVGLWIRPEYRHKGYGKQLLQATIKRGIQRGFNRMQVDAIVDPINRICDSLPEELKQRVDHNNLVISGFPVLLD